MEKLQLDHTSIKTEFFEHLSLSGNNRILFTAPFGAGKSTFLNEFFQEHDSKYFTLKLYPVNYSVSQNEDVFELIKFDLLLQLMGIYKEDVNLKKEDFSTLLLSQVYISEHLKVMPIVNALISLSGKVGKSAVEIIKSLGSTIDDFKAFQEEMKIDEEHEVKRFLSQIEGRKGSGYEMDEISELIFDLLERVKESKHLTDGPEVDSVLVIDDLDRLDPEHTFRLFNVFTAHFDEIDQRNKFGFNTVIFVCDIENIWKLYRHKYGVGVDFKGYMDKFYSYLPFDFDNRKYLKEKIGTFFNTLATNHTNSGQVFSLLTKSENNHDFYYVVRFVLLSLISAKALNLRTLVSNSRYDFPDYIFDTYKDRRANSDFPILLLFNLLKRFYTSLEIVKEKLILLDALFTDYSVQRSSEHESLNDQHILGILKSALLPFLLPREQGFKRLRDKNDVTVGYSSALGAWLHYETDHFYDKITFTKATIDADLESAETQISIYKMLLACFNECLKINAFR